MSTGAIIINLTSSLPASDLGGLGGLLAHSYHSPAVSLPSFRSRMWLTVRVTTRTELFITHQLLITQSQQLNDAQGSNPSCWTWKFFHTLTQTLNIHNILTTSKQLKPPKVLNYLISYTLSISHAPSITPFPNINFHLPMISETSKLDYRAVS